jgi:hypothetical protein
MALLLEAEDHLVFANLVDQAHLNLSSEEVALVCP